MIENKQRIELHCHSKSGGKATMYPGEIIKYLSEKGMPAFAITDESNIGSFPEFEKVWETRKYTSRPIYGMEIMNKGMDDADVNYMSVLIRNDFGKKTLYKLISNNESTEPYQLFKFEDFLNNRDGLLLGSGNEKGRVYKLALSGVSEKELREEISKYDYVEVLPRKQYENVNKIIIDACDVLNIPVVAIGNTRYFDKFGRKALEIMSCWNKETEDFKDNHFWTTEEMMKAFAYLTNEKAYEIVVENTHRIANMCETVSVCPKEKYIPIIPNAGIKLKEKCYASLREKYPTDDKAARDRLDWELKAIEKTGMESYVLQVKDLFNKAGLTSDVISLRGVAAGSMVAYLLNITSINPLAYGLEPETIFGINGQRIIDIDINIPSNMRDKVIDRLPEVDGIGKYVWAGTVSLVTDTLAQAMIENYMEYTANYYEDEVIEKIKWLISGNYLSRGKHPGGVIILPKECDYSSITPVAKMEGNIEITYFDFYNIDEAFVKLDLFKLDSLEMLNKLATMTGVELDTIPVDSSEVMNLFEEDSNGSVSGCDGLPEFESEYIRRIIAELRPKTFNDLVKVSAISHGTGSWKDNGEILVVTEDVGINEIIATRDDIFEYNLSLGLDRTTAFEIMELVRKGIAGRARTAKWQIFKKELIKAGAPKWYIWSCEQIRYLFPRAHAISYINMNMKLGWFKVHYPEEFSMVIKEYGEPV